MCGPGSRYYYAWLYNLGSQGAEPHNIKLNAISTIVKPSFAWSCSWLWLNALQFYFSTRVYRNALLPTISPSTSPNPLLQITHLEHNHRTTYRRKSILPQHTTAAPGQWLNKNEQIGPWTLKVQAIPKKHACERNADSKNNVQRMERDKRLRRRQGKGVRNMAHRHKVCRNNAMYSTTFHQRQDVLLFKSHL